MAKGWFTALVTADHRRMAELALVNGKIDEAVDNFTKGGFYLEAARLAEEHGRRAKAVELFIKAVLGKDADPGEETAAQQAGELLAASGQYKDAMPLFEAAQAWKQAADLAVKTNQPARAAKFYERAGLWTQAATNYERVNLPADSLRMLDKEAMRLTSENAKDAATRDRIRGNDAKRAELMTKLGRNADAAALYKAHGQVGRAAQLFATSGSVKEAAEAYLATGQLDQALSLIDKAPTLDPKLAAEIYRRAGRHRDAALLLATMGRWKDAAEAYEAAGDFGKSAELWEKARDPVRAAGAYQRANRMRDAGRCYDAGGQPLLAAEAHVAAGDHIAAAESFTKGGAFFQAAAAYLRAGRKGDCAKALQQVPLNDPLFEKATLDLAPLLMEEGMLEPALHRLRMLPAEPKGGPPVATDRHYWEGRVLESMGRGAEAEGCYQKVLTFNREHRDTARRIANLQRHNTLAAAPSGLTANMAVSPAMTAMTPTMPTEAGVSRAGGTNARLNELPIGYRLADRYEILAEIGQGGMGKVYKALDRELEDLVAIKTMLRKSGESGNDEERLLREVQICRRITSPNVVRVYDLGRMPDGIFVTMEYIDGSTLEEVLERQTGPSLPLGKIKWIIAEAAAGLKEAHALQVVHRDLKPSNLIVSETRLKILDFGIARVAGSSEARLTQTGFAVGTPMYMSPEQVRGAELDGRSDLYSLGIIGYRLLTGREPFVAEAATAIALMHLQSPPPDIETWRPGLAPEWKELIGKLLAKNVADRFQSAEELMAALRALPMETSPGLDPLTLFH